MYIYIKHHIVNFIDNFMKIKHLYIYGIPFIKASNDKVKYILWEHILKKYLYMCVKDSLINNSVLEIIETSEERINKVWLTPSCTFSSQYFASHFFRSHVFH